MTQRHTRRTGIAWLVGTKLTIALTLSLLTNFDRGTARYVTLGPLPGVEAGTPVILLGQRIGQVVAVSRRGDTTSLRVQFVREAERLPGSRTVRLRPLGFGEETALEMLADLPFAAPRRARSFTRGGWLRVDPPASFDRPFIDLPLPLRPTFPESPPLFHLLPLTPLPPPGPPTPERNRSA
jgi:hypothetical protein